MSESLPNWNEVIKTIDNVPVEPIKFALKTIFLYAGRASEVVGRKCFSDPDEARGPTSNDAELDTIEGNKAVLFHVRTAKRNGLERIVALPVDYEPWAMQVYDYFQRFDNKPVFPFTRQYLWQESKFYFIDWHCPIYKYKVGHKGEWQTVPDHVNDFSLHSLRHLRANMLRRYYKFTASDLGAYCGWRLTTVEPKMTSVMERYQDLTMDYLDYFPKLLKQRP